jgi:hypothetical protein
LFKRKIGFFYYFQENSEDAACLLQQYLIRKVFREKFLIVPKNEFLAENVGVFLQKISLSAKEKFFFVLSVTLQRS